MSEVYLAHHGILGQKWGIRRFQNADGSLTSAGKRRYDVSTDQLTKSRDLTNAGKEAVAAGRQIMKTADTIHSRKSSKDQVDLSSMTDKELQQKINRMNLERQYKNLTAPEVSRGHAFLEDALSIGGSALAVTGSALSIALAVKQLKGK